MEPMFVHSEKKKRKGAGNKMMKSEVTGAIL